MTTGYGKFCNNCKKKKPKLQHYLTRFINNNKIETCPLCNSKIIKTEEYLICEKHPKYIERVMIENNICPLCNSQLKEFNLNDGSILYKCPNNLTCSNKQTIYIRSNKPISKNTNTQNIFCPVCNSAMRLRDGKYGKFYGCSKYPYCKGTRNIEDIKSMINKANQDSTTSPIDWNSYMIDFQKKIKENWNCPKLNKSVSIIVAIRIGKNGNLIESKIHQSSNIAEADMAALKAVEISAPFNPLPQEHKGDYVDINFTFDYNIRT